MDGGRLDVLSTTREELVNLLWDFEDYITPKEFDASKFAELQAQFRALEDDIALQEERDLAGGLEPAIQEEDEEDEDGDDVNGLAESRMTESENLLSPRIRADSQEGQAAR